MQLKLKADINGFIFSTEIVPGSYGRARIGEILTDLELDRRRTSHVKACVCSAREATIVAQLSLISGWCKTVRGRLEEATEAKGLCQDLEFEFELSPI